MENDRLKPELQRLVGLLGERCQIRAATVGFIEHGAQPFTAKDAGQGKRGPCITDRCQRRIEQLLIAAHMIFATQAARLDINKLSGMDDRATAIGACVGKFDGHWRGLNIHRLTQDVAGFVLGEAHQGVALRRIGRLIDNQNGMGGLWKLMHVTERAVGFNDRDDF